MAEVGVHFHRGTAPLADEQKYGKPPESVIMTMEHALYSPNYERLTATAVPCSKHARLVRGVLLRNDPLSSDPEVTW